MLGLLPRLAELLDGRGDAVLPVPADDADQAHFLASELSADEPIADDVAVVVSTSGTTGKPKGAMLTGQALTASGTATATRLGGPGQWLLALPPITSPECRYCCAASRPEATPWCSMSRPASPCPTLCEQSPR